MSLAPPIAHLAAIELSDLNAALVAWGHRIGPWKRPALGREWFHGLHHNGTLVAVTATARLIPAATAGLSRDEACELGRVCAARPHLCRPMVRLWREFVFPALCARQGWRWAISYQDAVIHSGSLYRHDGWVRIGTSNSGPDARSGKRGRRKVIWGWCEDASERALQPADTACQPCSVTGCRADGGEHDRPEPGRPCRLDGCRA